MTERANTTSWMKVVLAVAGAALSLSTVACAGETSSAADVEVVQKSEAKIYGGERDQAATLTGVVALKVGNGTTFELCTGALVAPNLVLTARHCVSKNITPSVVCDENGRSGNGDHVSDDVDPQTINVFTGADPQFSRAPAAKAAQIVHAGGKVLCDADIALVVLDTALEDVPVMPVRVGQPIHQGETIKTIGYGRNDQKLPTGTRMQKAGVDVLAIGKGVSASKTPLGKHEFEVGRSICQGDSGGPSISESTGAVVGVVSRGADCRQDFGHVYTQTAGFESLFAAALIRADAKILTEDGEVVSGEDLAGSGAPAGSGCAVAGPGVLSQGARLSPVLALLGLVGLARRRRAR